MNMAEAEVECVLLLGAVERDADVGSFFVVL